MLSSKLHEQCLNKPFQQSWPGDRRHLLHLGRHCIRRLRLLHLMLANKLTFCKFTPGRSKIQDAWSERAYRVMLQFGGYNVDGIAPMDGGGWAALSMGSISVCIWHFMVDIICLTFCLLLAHPGQHPVLMSNRPSITVTSCRPSRFTFLFEGLSYHFWCWVTLIKRNQSSSAQSYQPLAIS